MLFPHPLSPTTPSVTPGYNSKLTPSTALTNPSSCRKYVFKFRTDNNASRGADAAGSRTPSTIERSTFERRLRRRNPRGDARRGPSRPPSMLSGGRQGGARRQARDDRRKGGKAPLRVST